MIVGQLEEWYYLSWQDGPASDTEYETAKEAEDDKGKFFDGHMLQVRSRFYVLSNGQRKRFWL